MTRFVWMSVVALALVGCGETADDTWEGNGAGTSWGGTAGIDGVQVGASSPAQKLVLLLLGKGSSPDPMTGFGASKQDSSPDPMTGRPQSGECRDGNCDPARMR